MCIFFICIPWVTVGPHWHSLEAQALSKTWSIPRRCGWVLIIPHRRSGRPKPTTVPSRSNQELVLKRLWLSALHSPWCGCLRGGGCCVVLYTKENIYSLVCKSQDWTAQQYGGRFHSTSLQLLGTAQASEPRSHQLKTHLSMRDSSLPWCPLTLYAMHYWIVSLDYNQPLVKLLK